MSKEESVTAIIMKSFPGVKIIEQYSVLGKRIDLYLPDHQLAIEFDKKGHMEEKKEKERENKIEKELGCKTIRINADSEKFNIHAEIGKIYNHISESNKKLTEELTKKSLIDKISRRLLELEFNQIKSNQSV